MFKMSKKAVLVLIIPFIFIQCTDTEELEKLKKAESALRTEYNKMKNDLDILQKDKVKLDFLAKQLEGITATINTSEGSITLEFYPEKAPIHVFNFVTRAESGFYNGTTFHRVIEGFMIQGGDPNSKDSNLNNDGQGGPIANIPHEFNDIGHEPGILSMARISNVNAGAGSQFFIMHGASPNLDGQYTAFGKVTDGMDVVNKIATMQKDNRDRPLKDVKIQSIFVQR